MAKYKVFSFDKINSTQTYAHELIANGRACDSMVIVARAQSAGRGRYRRKWVSHHGNLYVSFIYQMPAIDSRLAYAVAVAVAETLISFGAPVRIKWPNDILIDGAKISGVLIEYAAPFVIVGIGVNVHSNPTVEAYGTTRLDKFSDAGIAAVLSKLMKNMDYWRAADFAAVRTRWLELAVGLGGTVSYRGEKLTFNGINEAGALILKRGKEDIFVYGDEIFV